MTPRNAVLFLLCSFGALISCHKSGGGSPAESGVYASGELSNLRYGVAAYWVNGRLVSLTDTNHFAAAYAVTVAGNDVYAAGYIGGRNNVPVSRAVYWKNGATTYLSANFPGSLASAIEVVNGNVYVAGYDSSYSVYWVNGQETRLTNCWVGAKVNSMAVQGNDVYIAGLDRLFHPCYWKNGVQIQLTGRYSIAQSIAFSGNDMYIAGQMSDTITGKQMAVLWKNGVLTPLSDGSEDVVMSAIAIDGADVYVCGNMDTGGGYAPIIWKNGQILPGATPSSKTLYAWDIAVVNGKWYISGNESGPGRLFAAYWSSTGLVELDMDATRSSGVWGIFVKGAN